MIVRSINETFTPEELARETSRVNNGVTITLYEGDEPAVEEVPVVEPPNWLGLEQSLRYSNEFNKAYALASPKGLNLFTTTLVNGKLGDSSENGLAFAFQMLPVDFVKDENGQPQMIILFEWTSLEKLNINAALEANNFVYRLQ